MTKGCEKPALDIMFPGMSPKICIKASIGDRGGHFTLT
jgi:hypothetical protein